MHECDTLPYMSQVLEATTTVLDTMSVVHETNDLAVAQVAELFPACTQDEETFALAVIETSGNIAAAYRLAFGPDLPMPLANGKAMLARPQVALKVREITDKVQDASLISVGAHLHELAEIRDIAKATGQIKTALAAERARGEAVGIYQKHDAIAKGKGTTGGVNIMINMASKHDVDI